MFDDNITSTAKKGLDIAEPLIFERNGHTSGVDLPEENSDECPSEEIINSILEDHKRSEKNEIALANCSEPAVFRHYFRLSRWNFANDLGSYPLGSCTMKYNPKINEWAARLEGFANLHPLLPKSRLQGAMSIIHDLQIYLQEIGGFAAVSLTPAAGAQGEFAGIAIIKKALLNRGEKRKKILIPDSAHGTNPATAASLGFEVVCIKSGSDGCIDMEDFHSKLDDDIAAVMITNPNTLGIFEKDIVSICQQVHQRGGLVYGDGANLNAIMGVVRPGDLGIDVMHFNLHKTFTTPHGGGGPGCGAIGVSKELQQFLPGPIVVKNDDNSYDFSHIDENSIGRIRSFYGNFAMMIRAWTYIREMGAKGLKKASQMAVLNNNYVRAKLQKAYNLPYKTNTLHETVFDDKLQRENSDINTMHIAKRLLDYGIHSPTVYFPLIVKNALMIEPTETESKYDIDVMCDAFLQIAQEAKESPKKLLNAPSNTPIGRLDEVSAARNPILTWKDN